MLAFGKTLQRGQRLAAIPLLDTYVDVILLGSYFLITELLSFVCKRVYIFGGWSDQAIATVGRRLRREIRIPWRGGERRLTDSIEVLYVHATIKVEGSTEGFERDGGSQRRGVIFYSIFQLSPVITKSDSFVCPCLSWWLTQS